MNTLVPVLFVLGWVLTALAALYGLVSLFSERVKQRWWFWLLVAALFYPPLYAPLLRAVAEPVSANLTAVAPAFLYGNMVAAALAAAGGLALATDGKRAGIGVPMFLVALATCGLQFLVSSPSKAYTMHTVAAKEALKENLRANLDSAVPTIRTIPLVTVKAPLDGTVEKLASLVQGGPSKILKRLSSFTVPVLHEEWYTPVTQLRRVEHLPMTLKYTYKPGDSGLIIAEPVKGGEPKDTREFPLKQRAMSFGSG